MIDLTGFLNGIQTLAVTCTQFGDTGKGKYVDVFASTWADIVGRGNGGANAGHTICAGGRELVVNLVPSGILNPDVLNIIGSGVAVDPGRLIKEITMLHKAGVSLEKLRIALNAKLLLPQHVVLDRVREAEQGDGNIGTTGRGIGPCYADHIGRTGLILNDLLNYGLDRKLRRNLEEKIRILRAYDPRVVQRIMNADDLERGAFWGGVNQIFDVDAIVERYAHFGRELQELMTDTDGMMQRAVGRQRVLLEGSQGNLLSIDHGTYPYVTSSDCTVEGLAKGVGLTLRNVDLTLGIAKGFYMTRVGGGPFPTEHGGNHSAVHCKQCPDRATEVGQYPNPSVNDPDEFKQGIAIRRAGNEFGATTGRLRRTGWLDLPLLRYSLQFNGPNVIFTKLDVLDGVERIQVCSSYEYIGPSYTYGDRVIRKGDHLTMAIPDRDILECCVPNYVTFDGWAGPLRDIKNPEDIPPALKTAIEYVEQATGANIVIISVGPDRTQSIVRDLPL